MIAKHVHDALAQVRELKAQVIDSQRFHGYSGRIRLLGGVVALTGTAIMASGSFPATAPAHVIGWLTILCIAAVLNSGALLHWFFFDPKVKRDVRKLKPTLEMVPPLVVGAVFSVALYLQGELDLLFGTWMCCYGLANVATRHVIPHSIVWVGLFYLAAGTVCLFLPGVSFLNPWPMGLVFFVGELAGGLILHFDLTRTFPVYRPPAE